MMPVCVPTAARTILCQLLKGKGDKDQSSREQCNGMFQIWLVMSRDGLVALLRHKSSKRRIYDRNSWFMLHFHTRRLLQSQWLVEHSGPKMRQCGWYSDNVIGSLDASLQLLAIWYICVECILVPWCQSNHEILICCLLRRKLIFSEPTWIYLYMCTKWFNVTLVVLSHL